MEIREHIYAFIDIRHITNSTHSIVLQCLEINEYRKCSPALLPIACTVCTTYPGNVGQTEIQKYQQYRQNISGIKNR